MHGGDLPPQDEVEGWALDMGLTERIPPLGVASYSAETKAMTTEREWEDALGIRTVAYYEVSGMGHTWRKGSDFEAMRVIWKFFIDLRP